MERAEGWSAPDFSQASLYYDLDQRGWLKAQREEGGPIIGFISVLRYNRFAYLSSFIVQVRSGKLWAVCCELIFPLARVEATGRW
jgi:hypothetical protein